MPRFKIPDKLEVGQTLENNQYLQSPNGKYRLGFRIRPKSYGDSDLYLYEGDTTLWSQNVWSAKQVRMLGDGNAVLKEGGGYSTYWDTNTKSPVPLPDALLQVLDEGVAIVKAAGVVRWSSHPEKVPASPVVSAEWTVSIGENVNKIACGQILLPGQSLSSTNGKFSAVFLETGELQVVRKDTKQTLWSFKLADGPLSKLCLTYGHFLYALDANGKTVRSLEAGNKVSWLDFDPYGSLCLDDDGHLWLDQPHWPRKSTWEIPHNDPPWHNHLWLPASIGRVESLLPGHSLAIDHTLQRTNKLVRNERKVQIEMKAGFTSAGDLYVINSDTKTYYYTGMPKDNGEVVLLKFNLDSLSLLGREGKVLWTINYEEPKGIRMRDQEWDNPPKLLIDGYGYLSVLYMDRMLWSSDSLKSGDQPTA